MGIQLLSQGECIGIQSCFSGQGSYDALEGGGLLLAHVEAIRLERFSHTQRVHDTNILGILRRYFTRLHSSAQIAGYRGIECSVDFTQTVVVAVLAVLEGNASSEALSSSRVAAHHDGRVEPQVGEHVLGRGRHTMLAPEQGANCLQYRVDNAGQFAGLGTLTQANQILVGQVPCHELVESTGISLSSRQATVVLPTPDSSNSVVVRLLQSSIRLHQFTFHTEELIHQHPNAFHCSFGLRMQSVTVEESQNGFEGGSMHQLVNHRFSGRVQGVDLLLTDVGEALDLTIHLTITSTNRTGVLDVLANVGSRADYHCVTLGSQGRHDITQHTVLTFRQLDGFGDVADVFGVELVDTFTLSAQSHDFLGQSISCHRLST